MLHDHSFSQRNKTAERAVGLGIEGDREQGWIKLEKGGVGNIGEGLCNSVLGPLSQL